MKKNKILFITLSFLLIYNIVYPSKNNDLPNPNKFNWIYGPKSEEYYKFRSVIHLNKNEILLHGNDASDYYYLSQGVKNSQDFIYFTINDDKSENTTYVNYFKSGYISIEDWDSFDSLEVLSAIKQNFQNYLLMIG